MKRQTCFALACVLSLCSLGYATTTNLVATIDGAQANAGAGSGSPGVGSATMTYDDATNIFAWNISWSGLVGTETLAHFHGPALPDQNAGVQVDFAAISGLVSPSIGSTTISPSQATDLLNGLWYINIHTDAHPGGEIRGRVLAGTTDTVTLLALRDNTLYEDESGALSNGEGDHFFAGRTGTNAIRRGLVAFDIAAIPVGSVVDSAAVTFHMSRTQVQDSPQLVGLHRCDADWGEAGSHALGEEGQGAPAAMGDATWIHRFFDTQFWGSPGGDFQALPSATVSVNNQGFYTWSTGALLSDVQGWLSNPSANFGWTVLGNEGASSTSKRFDSIDHDSTNVRPRLFLRFTTPTDVTGRSPLRVARLHPNVPNPFNPGTRISYELAKSGPAVVRVYDVSGGLVRTLVNTHHDVGTHIVWWDGTSDRGSRVASGVYMYVLQTSDSWFARRMLLLR